AVADADYLKVADVQAVRDQMGSRIVAATGVMNNYDRMRIEGREEDVSIIGARDIQSRNHAAMLPERLAKRLFRGQTQAIGQTVQLHGLQFDIIGTFK